MQQGNLWGSWRSEALNPALLLKALKSSRLCPEGAPQQCQALDSHHANSGLVGSVRPRVCWHAGKLGKSVSPM